MQHYKITKELCKKSFISDEDSEEICKFINASYLKKPYGKMLVFYGKDCTGKTFLLNELFKLDGLHSVVYSNIFEMINSFKNTNNDNNFHTMIFREIPISILCKNLKLLIDDFNIIVETNELNNVNLDNSKIIHFEHKFN